MSKYSSKLEEVNQNNMKAIPIRYKIILSFLIPYILGIISMPKEWWRMGFFSTLFGALSYPMIAMGSGVLIGLLSLLSVRTKENFWHTTFMSSLVITLLMLIGNLIPS